MSATLSVQRQNYNFQEFSKSVVIKSQLPSYHLLG